MMTDQDILDLIGRPKAIVKREPAHSYRIEHRQRRCDLDLRADADGGTFEVFIRQHTDFIENFSIGLRFQTSSRLQGRITLTRYNGSHGESSRAPDGHYALPHIHRLTAEELASGSIQPQEKERQITTRYGAFEQALEVFFADVGITNALDYFPELQQRRLPLC